MQLTRFRRKISVQVKLIGSHKLNESPWETILMLCHNEIIMKRNFVLSYKKSPPIFILY